MKILIVGGSGFIGENLTKKVHQLKYNYISSYRKKIPNRSYKYFKLDLKELSKYKKKILTFNPEIIIYLAWDKIPDYSKKNSINNVNTAKKFFNFTFKLKSLKKIIVSGSCFEKKKDDNVKFFSKAKKDLKSFLILKSRINKVGLTWLRIFYVYGFGQNKKSLIPTLINNLKNKYYPAIHNLSALNDYIYIDDVINLFIRSIKYNNNVNIFDCGSGKLSSVNQICYIVEKILLKKNILYKNNNLKKKYTNEVYANISSLQKKLGWVPKTSLEKGIVKTIKNYLR